MNRALILSLALLSSQNAFADNTQMKMLIDMLRDNGVLNEQQHAMLIAAMPTQSNHQPVTVAPSTIPSQPAVSVATNQSSFPTEVSIQRRNDLTITSQDGSFSHSIGVELMYDIVGHNAAANQLSDGTLLRKAEIEFSGHFLEHWGYELEVDFAEGNVDINDAYITYNAHWPLTFIAGQYKEPFGLEELSSIGASPLMERSVVSELAPGRNIGFGAHYDGGNWTLAGGLFGQDFNDDLRNRNAPDDGDEGWGMSARATYSPVHTDTRALHFGVAGSHRTIDDLEQVSFETTPETSVTGVEFLNTGNINNVDRITLTGLEAAFVEGPYSAQAEVIHASLAGNNVDLGFSGWYVMGSWFVTGESRNYDANQGSFSRVEPYRKEGAVELVARFSELDLNDEGVTGGLQQNLSLGVNWHLNEQVRLMAQYIRVHNDVNADDDGNVIGGDDVNIVQMRIQANF